LGNLMREANPAPLSSESAAQPANRSPGLAAILSGSQFVVVPEAPPTHGPSATPTLRRPRKRLLQFSLILADLLLSGFAGCLVLRSHGRLGFLELALCILALGAGAWLTCLALLLD
jgi:hypothetical protein